MKKVFNYIILIAVFLFPATSCDDVLDQKSVDSFDQKDVFTNLNVAKAFLGNLYDRMGGTSGNVLGGREDLLSSGTDQTLCIHRPANYTNVKGTLTADNLRHFGDQGRMGWIIWNPLYLNIQNTNTFLANIDKVPATTQSEMDLVTRMKGEAYFIRAYNYANLLMSYGGVVLLDKPNVLGADFQGLTRSTIAQTKDFVLADIAQAIALLPASMDQGRASRAAAAALKSRLLTFCASDLCNGGYEPTNTLVSFPAGSQTALRQAARDAAKDVINGTYGAYSLVGSTADPVLPLSSTQIKALADNYANIFVQKGRWNSETIWGIQYVLTGGNSWNPNIWYGPNGYHNWGNNNPTEPAVREFEMANGTPFQWDKYTPGNNVLRTATAAQLAADPERSPYNGREARFYATVLYHGATWQARPADAAGFDPLNVVQSGHFYRTDGTKRADGIDTRTGLIESWNATKIGYYLKKFMDPGSQGQYFSNTNHWVEFRYAEILLNYAEVCIDLGGVDLQPGIDAMNMVRNRSGLPDRVTTDQVTARNWLRHERFIEFFAEPIRWYDIRKWVICSTVIKDVFEMKIKQFDDGAFEWKYDLGAKPDARTFNVINYWLPLTRDEVNKAPSLQQNPGY